MELCGHRDQIRISQLPEAVEGCVDCPTEGGPWLHLRICLECGHVGCCDEYPSRHATAHANTTGHPIVRSLAPGEEWSWCYIDRVGMLTTEVTGIHSNPTIATGAIAGGGARLFDHVAVSPPRPTTEGRSHRRRARVAAGLRRCKVGVVEMAARSQIGGSATVLVGRRGEREALDGLFEGTSLVL
jgi:hypothetical protein